MTPILSTNDIYDGAEHVYNGVTVHMNACESDPEKYTVHDQDGVYLCTIYESDSMDEINETITNAIRSVLKMTEKYKIEIVDNDTAFVTWDNGAYIELMLEDGDADLLRNGHDPVFEEWDNGEGLTVCYENATQVIDGLVRRVCKYITDNYDTSNIVLEWADIGVDLEDWVDGYIGGLNQEVDYPYNDYSDDNDVYAIGDMILSAFTQDLPYKTYDENGLTLRVYEKVIE